MYRELQDLQLLHQCSLQIKIFWDVTPPLLVNTHNYRRFEGKLCCLILKRYVVRLLEMCASVYQTKLS
jgi:hypothetical protein